MIATVNATATASEIVAANANRKLLILQNLSDTDIFIKLDESPTEVTVSNGLKLTANGNPFIIITSKAGQQLASVRAIHAGTGNKSVRVQEDSWI